MNSIKMEDIQKFPAFKDTLKEENSRGHNIFNWFIIMMMDDVSSFINNNKLKFKIIFFY